MASQFPQWQLVQGMQKMNLGQTTSQGWQMVNPLQSAQMATQNQQAQPGQMPPMQQMQQQAQQVPVYQAPGAFYPSAYLGPPLGPTVNGPPFSAPAAYAPVAPNYATPLQVRKLHRAKPTEDSALGAVIVTITGGSSYDPIFQEVAQTDDQGTSVATYWVSLSGLEHLGKALEDPHSSCSETKELREDLQRVPATKVVFNWECCSMCSEAGFQSTGFGCCPYSSGSSLVRSRTPDASLKLAKLALDRGYMVMFSDFSLKALISQWDVSLFGPNPFRQTGVCTGQVQLNFDPKVLQSCSSRQLAKVGELCQDGKAVIHAASNTIVYELQPGVAENAQRSQTYQLQMLTTATAVSGDYRQNSSATAGHALLTYPSGGRMLTSAGHWKELVHLSGVSEEALLRVTEQYYGKAFSTNLNAQLQQCPDMGSRMQMQQAVAQQCVQSSAPY